PGPDRLIGPFAVHVHYRLQRGSLVHRVREADVRNDAGEWRAAVFESRVDENVHIALVKGDVAGDEPVLVRVHSGCTTSEALGLDSCTCGAQLHRSMQAIAAAGRGV